MNYIVRNYGYEKITVDDGNSIDNDDYDIVDEEEKGIGELDLIQRVKIIPCEEMYTYFLVTISNFSKTYYGREIIRKYEPNNPQHSNYAVQGIIYDELPNFKFVYVPGGFEPIPKNYFIKHNYEIILPENIGVKYKFIYNYAKSFVLTYDNGVAHYKPKWNNMNIFQKEKMIEFLNMSYLDGIISQQSDISGDHFNIMSFKKYYMRTYSNSTANFYGTNVFFEPDYNSKNDPEIYIKNLGKIIGCLIFDKIREKLIHMVFETHIVKGLLSEYVINSNLTDNQKLGSSYDEKKTKSISKFKKICIQ